MKIPGENFKVKVGPFIYDVVYSDDVSEEGAVFGSTHNNDQKIFLDPKRPQQKINQTFIHELLHACNFVNGLTYRFDKRLSEEDVARELSMTLYQVFQDNPEIFGETNGKVAKEGKEGR